MQETDTQDVKSLALAAMQNHGGVRQNQVSVDNEPIIYRRGDPDAEIDIKDQDYMDAGELPGAVAPADPANPRPWEVPYGSMVNAVPLAKPDYVPKKPADQYPLAKDTSVGQAIGGMLREEVGGTYPAKAPARYVASYTRVATEKQLDARPDHAMDAFRMPPPPVAPTVNQSRIGLRGITAEGISLIIDGEPFDITVDDANEWAGKLGVFAMAAAAVQESLRNLAGGV